MDAELFLDQVIGAEPGLARFAVNERIVEIDDVAGRLPDLRVHENAAVEPDHIAPALHEGAPPELLDIVPQFSAERTEIPRVGESAIDIGAREHKSPALAQRYDLFHRGGPRCVGHVESRSLFGPDGSGFFSLKTKTGGILRPAYFRKAYVFA